MLTHDLIRLRATEHQRQLRREAAIERNRHRRALLPALARQAARLAFWL